MVKFAVLGFILLYAVYTDVRYGVIRNLLTFPALAAGVVWSGFDGSVWWDGLAGALLGIGFFYPLWYLDKFAGGDAKLMGVVGAFGGLRFAFWSIAFTLAAGALFSLLVLLLQGRLLRTLQRLGFGLATHTLDTGTLSSAGTGQKYPYAFAIAAGAIVSWLSIHRGMVNLPW